MLATRCPHCQTTFRVAHDQLKLRSGLVRCGACKEIFNGIEHLLQSDEPSLPTSVVPVSSVAPHKIITAPVAAIPESPPTATVVNETPAVIYIPPIEKTDVESALLPEKEFADFSEFLVATASAAVPATENVTSAVITEVEIPADPLQGMTLMDLSSQQPITDDHHEVIETDTVVENIDEETEVHEPDPAIEPVNEPRADPLEPMVDPLTPIVDPLEPIADPLAQAIDNLHRMPPRTKSLDELRPGFRPPATEPVAEEVEPEFVRRGRRKQQLTHIMRWVMSIGSVLLLFILLFQAAYIFRNSLAASFPTFKPALESLCAPFGCRLELPTQIDDISIESSDFQALAGHDNTLTLSMLLRNRSRTAQTWPQLELTLNDANDQPIARRIFSPKEYLPRDISVAKGFPPYSEQSVKVYFEVSQLKPEGYRLYVFYP